MTCSTWTARDRRRRVFRQRVRRFALSAAVVAACTLSSALLRAQNPPPAVPAANSPAPAGAQTSASGSVLRIAPGDELDVSVYGVPELTQHVRVTGDGDIYFPLIGHVHVADLSSDQAQAVLESRLAQGNFVKNPQVTVYVKEYTGAAISIGGEVTKPGSYPPFGPHRLFDLLQIAGGLTQRAGNTATVVHASAPDKPLTLQISPDAPQAAQNNIELLPGDTVIVSRAAVVYVMGEVNKAGEYVVENGKPITVLQAIAMAAGPTHVASLKSVRMIHRAPGGMKETTVAVNKIMQGKEADRVLEANDIVFVPDSRTKSVASSTSILNTLSMLAIYRF